MLICWDATAIEGGGQPSPAVINGSDASQVLVFLERAASVGGAYAPPTVIERLIAFA